MSDCLYPVKVRNTEKNYDEDGAIMPSPCGKCINCTQRRARQWSFRLHEENKIAKSAYFLTLTYNNESITPNDDFKYPELRKDELQKFLKRVRAKNDYHHPEMGKLKYYAVGEYGGQTGRPHYHIIIFNLHPNIKLHKCWHSGKEKKPMGNIRRDPVNMATISYVTGYVMKRDLKKSDDLNRKREFSIMSKGLGLNYVENNAEYHRTNETYMANFQGTNIALPIYYKEKIWEGREEERAKVARKQELENGERIAEKHERLIKKGHEDPERYMKQSAYAKARARQNRLSKDKH